MAAQCNSKASLAATFRSTVHDTRCTNLTVITTAHLHYNRQNKHNPVITGQLHFTRQINICYAIYEVDHSSRGALPTVARRCVWSRNLVREEVIARYRAAKYKPTMVCSASRKNNIRGWGHSRQKLAYTVFNLVTFKDAIISTVV